MTTFADVRPANGTDLPALAALYRAVLDGLVDVKGYEHFVELYGREDVSGSLSADLADDDSVVLMAERAGVAVGWATVTWERGHTRLVGRIRELAVDPELRRVGIGTEILDQIKIIASNRGAASLCARVLPGDRSSKNFFERTGLTAHLIEVASAL